MHLVANFDQPAVDRGLSAVDLIREIAPIVGGGGGGRPTMARAGGADPGRLTRRWPPELGDPALCVALKVVAIDYGRAAPGWR